MEMITTPQLMCINAMINKLGLQAAKPHLVLGFTLGRSESSKDLYKDEAILLIKHLKDQDPEEQAAQKMRKKIIARAHEMRWELYPGKADMQRIDGWCTTYGYLKKKLNQYNLKELPKLVTQFEGVYLSYLKGL